VIVDGTKNSRIGFIQPAGGKSAELVGDFQSFIQQAAIQSNFNRLGYKGTIELTLQCQKNALADNIAGGNEPIYIDYIRSLIRASEDLLMKI